MRNLKTKLGLSVAALAFTFAGAINMQSTVNANADVDISGLSMMNGASVCLEDDFSGIRWTTKVDSTWFNATCVGNSYQFGVIVAPNVAAKDLTHETAGVKDLPVTGSLDASAQDVTYYSVIDYNNILENYTGNLTDEEVLAKAYALELTARAYVQLDGTYYYANMTGLNTSRSARQVAIAAELAGEIDADDTKAWEYYGEETQYAPAVKSIGAVGTAVIDMENPTATVEVSMEIAGNFQEALVGGQKVTATYADGTLSITDATGIPTGENYITVFTDEGVYTTPVIGATKVFDEMSDFDDFKYIRKNLKKNSSGGYKVSADAQKKDVDGNKIDASKLTHDGYYVLKTSLDATDYATSDYTYTATKTVVTENDDGSTTETQEAITCEGYYGVKDFMESELGLTGTFNGMGYTISKLTMNRAYSGLFEVINGGTIKNLSIETLKMTSTNKNSGGLAYYAIDPVLENVSVATSGFSARNKQCTLFYYIGQTENYSSKLTNVFAWTKFSSGKDDYGVGGLFGVVYGNNTAFKWDNVYSLCPVGLSWTLNSKKTVMDVYAYGDNQKTEDGFNVYTTDGVESTLTPTKTYYLEGVSQFYTNNQLRMSGVTFDAFINDPSGCWTRKEATAKIDEVTYTYYVPEFKL